MAKDNDATQQILFNCSWRSKAESTLARSPGIASLPACSWHRGTAEGRDWDDILKLSTKSTLSVHI